MCYHMDPAYFIEVVSRRYMRGAIDWETGTCDFDNPEFIALLKAAARVKEDRTDSGIDVDNGMNFDSYYAGKEISYFGYPSPDGEDGLFVKLDFQLGVCATTKHQKGCRALVESADTLDLCDPRALAIIKDEAASYLSGAQSAEDTARVIQERMSIYVSEQS